MVITCRIWEANVCDWFLLLGAGMPNNWELSETLQFMSGPKA